MDFSDRLLRHDADGLCTLTLNRPDKLNAIDGRMVEALDAAVTALESQDDRVGCVVLKGTGRAFCAGVDLNALGSDAMPRGSLGRVLERLSKLPQPTIAAVHGFCFTGALEVALAFDFIVADPLARFGDTHGKWGLIAGAGMSERLPRRIGLARAQMLTFTSRHITVEEAARIGLVDVVAAENGLDETVAGLAAEILQNSWYANSAHKRVMRETVGLPIDAALELGREIRPGHAPDFKQRIAGFTKK